MPKENINDEVSTGFRVEVSWGSAVPGERDGHVQIATTNEHSPYAMPPEPMPVSGNTTSAVSIAVQEAERAYLRGLASSESTEFDREKALHDLNAAQGRAFNLGATTTLTNGGEVNCRSQFDGWHVTLDRAGINRLIRSLRRARDSAYGADA